MKKLTLAISLAIIIPTVFPVIIMADAPPSSAPSSVIITEIKLGGDSYSQGTDQPKDPQEFITLYNQSGGPVDLTSWVLEYAKTTFDKNYCSDGNWVTHSVSGSASQTALSGTLQPGQVSTPVARSLTDNTAGSLHLVNASDKNNPVVEDLVGWGTGAPCFENVAASTPSNGKSIKRYLGCDNSPIDSNNNAQDFAANQPPSPGMLSNPYLTTCVDTTSSNTAQTQQPTCEGVVISELLPNPSGTDNGNEFIELYNPTASAIQLQGCSLQTTSSSKVYNFANTSLQPGEYHAFYNTVTGLTLPNAAGGTVWLLSPSIELQAISYPGNLDDDVAWAQINGAWQSTYQPTPNAPNVLVALKPCDAGEVRNPDTGYCDSVASLTTSVLTVCKAGQEINPATGRCKAVASSSSNMAPCGPGQERNPATNRCKAIATTISAALKPCPAGQERNPATNRCRKITSTSAASKINGVKDAVAGSIASSPHWWIAGFAIVGATSYGIYEWRQELTNFLGKLKTKLPRFSR